MTWALAYIIVTLALALVLRGRRIPLVAIAIGLTLIAVLFPIFPAEYFPLWHAMLWTTIGAFVAASSKFECWLGAILLVVSGVLLVPSYFVGGDYGTTDPFAVASDVAGVAAILFTAFPRLLDVVGSCLRRRGSDLRGSLDLEAQIRKDAPK